MAIEGHDLVASASMGIAIYPDDGTELPSSCSGRRIPPGIEVKKTGTKPLPDIRREKRYLRIAPAWTSNQD